MKIESIVWLPDVIKKLETEHGVQSVDEEAAFWETHDSADYWDEMEEVVFDVDLHPNLLHPKLIVLAELPERCPRCGHDLNNVFIQHVTWSNDHLLIIRDVPALRCGNGHEYLLEDTLDEIEKLLDLEKSCRIEPMETIQIPVFSLKKTA